MEERGKAITHDLDYFVCLFIIIILIKKNFFLFDWAAQQVAS